MTAPNATFQAPYIDGPKHRPLLHSLPILIVTVHLTVPLLSGPFNWLAEQRGRTSYLYLDHYLGIHWALASASLLGIRWALGAAPLFRRTFVAISGVAWLWLAYHGGLRLVGYYYRPFASADVTILGLTLLVSALPLAMLRALWGLQIIARQPVSASKLQQCQQFSLRGLLCAVLVLGVTFGIARQVADIDTRHLKGAALQVFNVLLLLNYTCLVTVPAAILGLMRWRYALLFIPLAVLHRIVSAQITPLDPLLTITNNFAPWAAQWGTMVVCSYGTTRFFHAFGYRLAFRQPPVASR